jgi:hypothetical protein
VATAAATAARSAFSARKETDDASVETQNNSTRQSLAAVTYLTPRSPQRAGDLIAGWQLLRLAVESGCVWESGCLGGDDKLPVAQGKRRVVAGSLPEAMTGSRTAPCI